MTDVRLRHFLRQISIIAKRTTHSWIRLPRKLPKLVLEMNDTEIGQMKDKWMAQEVKMKEKLVILENSEDDLVIKYPFKIGGADLSFFPDDTEKAVCCYVILEYLQEDQIDPNVLKKDLKLVDLSE